MLLGLGRDLERLQLTIGFIAARFITLVSVGIMVGGFWFQSISFSFLSLPLLQVEFDGSPELA